MQTKPFLPSANKKIQSMVIIFLFLFSANLAAKDYDFTAPKSVLDGYIQSNKLAGGVILVIKDGEEVLHYAAGKQDIEADTDMQTDSLFRIASQTKALTSVATMILHERGLIGLQDPVSKYIPAFKNTKVLVINDDETQSAVPAQREITIHDLLTHSAGIDYGYGANQKDFEAAGLHGWYFAGKNQTMKEALAPITTLAHKAQPGTEFVYGHNTDILGVIIEIVSGKSLQAFFKTEITEPLGMTDTDFYVPKTKLDRLTAVYNATDTGIIRATNPTTIDDFMTSQGHYSEGPMKAFSGGAGLVSTASDYAKLLMMLLNEGTLNERTILTPASVNMMTRDQIPYIDMLWNDGFGYGFALEVGKEGALKGKTLQYQWGGAYHSNYYVRPEDKLIVVYLTQLRPAKDIKDWPQIDAVIKIALGIEP